MFKFGLRNMERWSRGAVFLSLFFLQAYLVRFSLWGYRSNLQEIFVGVSVVLTVLMLWRGGRWPKLREHLVLICFLGLSVVSLLFSFVLGERILSQVDLMRHLKFLMFAGALSFVFLENFRSEEERIKGLKVLGLGAVGFGVFSVIYNLLGWNVTHDLRLLGPLDAAVYLAYYLTPFWVFFVVRAFETRRSADVSLAIVLGILVVATRSMGAIAAGFMVVCWYLLRRGGPVIMNGKLMKVLMWMVGVTIVVAIFYMKILPTILTPWSSLDERGEIWSTAFHLLKDPVNLVFGLGLSQFEAYYQLAADGVLGRPPLDLHVIQPHNIFLLFIFNYGILGIGFLGWLVWSICRNSCGLGVITVKSVSSLMMFYFLIHGFIDTPFYKNDLLALFIIFSSLCVLPEKLSKEPD